MQTGDAVNLREKLASLGYTKDYYLMQSAWIISDTAVATRQLRSLWSCWRCDRGPRNSAP
jgi:hypothetical protein